jgi:hypothetical protein
MMAYGNETDTALCHEHLRFMTDISLASSHLLKLDYLMAAGLRAYCF